MKIKIYCLPTIENRILFHAEYPKVETKLELGSLFAGYCLRKWRYQLSDSFAYYWHQLPQQTSSTFISKTIYNLGNRLTTRRCSDEYFFKSIPFKTGEIEFIYPSSLQEDRVKHQLAAWMRDAHKYAPKSLFFGILLPTNFYIAKFFLVAAQAGFTYHLFRLNATVRAHLGSQKIQHLANRRKITWTSSKELQDLIKDLSRKTSKELESQAANDATASKGSAILAGENPCKVWEWKDGQDLHDNVIRDLEKELKLPELLQTARRTRMQYYVHSTS